MNEPPNKAPSVVFVAEKEPVTTPVAATTHGGGCVYHAGDKQPPQCHRRLAAGATS